MKAILAFCLIITSAVLLVIANDVSHFDLLNNQLFQILLLCIVLFSAGFLYWPHLKYLIRYKNNWEKNNNLVTKQDIKVLRYADSLLANENNWDQNDDRHCLIWAKKSLFCAVALAQKELAGGYSHRSVPVEEIRFIIEEQYPKRWSEHPIMDFNNHKETTFYQVKGVIALAIKRMELRL